MPVRVILLVVLAAAPSRADLTPAEWQRARREAARLVRKPGEVERKLRLVETLATEDGARTAELLVELAASSVERQAEFQAAAPKAAEALREIDRKLRRKHGGRPSRAYLEQNRTWRKRDEEYAAIRAGLVVEETVQESIGRACARFRSFAAIGVLVSGKPDASAARRSGPVRAGILAALWKQPAGVATPHLVAFAHEDGPPHERVRILDWIGDGRVRLGYQAAVAALRAPEPVVARAAVAALRKLDDPGCVPALIEARRGADGLLADEIEQALHWFTGKEFFGAGADAMWAGWWRDHGAAWLAGARKKRYDAVKGKGRGGAEFYGIATRSNRIVFVLDRSGSMKEPVPHRGPITGPGADRVPGRTKLEVAKNQLARTIRSLAIDVRFAVVFYSGDVHVWEKPPTLLPATPENKKAAVDWFTKLEPEGSTLIFDALHRALRYASVGRGGKSPTDVAGADTIFLLSDGAPTVPDGMGLLTGTALEAAVAEFLERNRPYRCVVHTIGIGPAHNRALMQRLAKATGGTYKAVGVK
jgi:hypothetical protein